MKKLDNALEELREQRGIFLRVQRNAPDARYSSKMKYFLICCQNNSCIKATATQKEMISFLKEYNFPMWV